MRRLAPDASLYPPLRGGCPRPGPGQRPSCHRRRALSRLLRPPALDCARPVPPLAIRHAARAARCPCVAQKPNGGFDYKTAKLTWSRDYSLEKVLVHIRSVLAKSEYKSLKQPPDGQTYQ